MLKKFCGTGLILAVSTLAMASGCATPGQGALTGGATGAAVGGVVGHQSGSALEGAAIGGALGAVGGAIVGNENQRQERGY